MFKMLYRVEVRAAGAGGAVGALLTGINADYSKNIGLNSAVNSAMAFVRRYQAIGTDAEAVVYGKPIDFGGNAPAEPLRELTAGELTEQIYAHIDTPGRGLKQAISRANTSADSVGGGALDGDVAPDLPAIV